MTETPKNYDKGDNITELTKLVATQANTVAMLISRTGNQG